MARRQRRAAIAMLIDTHSHFDAGEFDADRPAAYARARAAGVGQQVVPAVSYAGWPNLKAVVARYAGLHAAYGLHPCYLAEHRPEHLAALKQWVERERPVAVGECGLDLYIESLDPALQEQFFLAQLRLARDYELPVIVHARRAVDQVLKCIRRIGGLRGVVHSYAGSLDQARRLRQLGFLVSLGGPLAYPRAERLHRLARELPLDGLLLETDAPDQPGPAHAGQRNEPAYLPEVLAELARLRDSDPAEIAAATHANACRLFALPAAPQP